MSKVWRELINIKVDLNTLSGEVSITHKVSEEPDVNTKDIYRILQAEIARKYDTANRLKREANTLCALRDLVNII